MSVEPDFLSAEDVLELHQIQLERFGGGVGIVTVGHSSRQSLNRKPRSAARSFTVTCSPWLPLTHSTSPRISRSSMATSVRDWRRPSSSSTSTVSVADPKGRLYQAVLDIADRNLDKAGLAALLAELAE